MNPEQSKAVRAIMDRIEQSRQALDRAVQRGYGDTVGRIARDLSAMATELEAITIAPEYRTLGGDSPAYPTPEPPYRDEAGSEVEG